MDDQVVDQVEQRIVRPVHVLEDQQERLPFGEMLHQHPHREQQVDRLIGRRVEPEPEEQAQVARGIGGAGVSGKSSSTAAATFARATSTGSFS